MLSSSELRMICRLRSGGDIIVTYMHAYTSLLCHIGRYLLRKGLEVVQALGSSVRTANPV